MGYGLQYLVFFFKKDLKNKYEVEVTTQGKYFGFEISSKIIVDCLGPCQYGIPDRNIKFEEDNIAITNFCLGKQQQKISINDRSLG